MRRTRSGPEPGSHTGGSADARVLEEFVAARWHALYRTAYLLTQDRHEAEDLLQTALINTCARLHHLRDHGALEGYVRTALVHQATRTWRRRGRAVPTAVVPDRGHDGGVGGHEDRDLLWVAVGTLPPRMRATLVLRYYEGLSEAETAAVLDCSVGSVKSQTHHALKRLRAALGESRATLAEDLR